MAIRTVSGAPYRVYNAEADRDFSAIELATILYICGLDGASLDQLSIDEMLTAVDDVYPQIATPTWVTEAESKMFKPAAGSFVMKQNVKLSMVLKKSWRTYSLANLKV